MNIKLTHLEKQFANSILPLPLIDASAYGIAGCECIVGLLLIAGLRFASPFPLRLRLLGYGNDSRQTGHLER